MGSDERKGAWFEEFKKVNGSAPAAAGSAGAGSDRRRKHARFTLHDATVKLYRRGATAIFGLASLNIEGVVLDLSEGGLRIETDEKLLKDTKVRLKITVAKFNDTLEADGVTRWCHSHPKNPDRFQVGIEFAGPDPAIARKIGQMRGWYTSAQYQVVLAQYLRDKKRF